MRWQFFSWRFFFICVAFVELSGCYQISYLSRLPNGSSEGRSYSGTNHIFLYGLVSTSDVDVGRDCPDGLARAKLQQTFVDGLLAAVTFGFYTPRSYN